MLTELEMRADAEARHAHRELVEAYEAKLAAAYEAAAQEMVNWGTLHCGHEDVTDEILRDIRTLTPADAKAALDRLIAEAEERGAQRERELQRNREKSDA